MRRQFRFCLVGAGAIAATHVASLDRISAARLVGVADIDVARAAELAGRSEGVRTFGDWREMFAEVQPDVAIVCTPPDSHPEIAIGAAQRGIHVLCEKPLAIDLPAARAMIAASQNAGTLLMMATKFRYVEDVIKARNAVQLGVLGDIVLVANEFKSVSDMRSRWNSNGARSGGGVLIDNGTHSVDILRYLLGTLRDVSAVEGPRSQGLSVEESVRLYVRSEVGAYGTVDLSWSEASTLPHYVRIVGTRGRIALGWKESTIELEGRAPERFGNGYDKVAAFTAQLDRVVSALRGDAPLQSEPADALASVAAIDAAYASLASEGWVLMDGSRTRQAASDEARFAIA